MRTALRLRLSVVTTHTIKMSGICSGRQIVIKGKDNDSTFLPVNIYNNGTVMFQHSEPNRSPVQDDFNTIIPKGTDARREM